MTMIFAHKIQNKMAHYHLSYHHLFYHHLSYQSYVLLLGRTIICPTLRKINHLSYCCHLSYYTVGKINRLSFSVQIKRKQVRPPSLPSRSAQPPSLPSRSARPPSPVNLT